MYKKESGIKIEPLKEYSAETLLSVDENVGYLQKSFVGILIGPPSSGKTTLIQSLLTLPELYLKKFHKIVFISPSKPDFLELDSEGWWPNLKMTWLLKVLDHQSELGSEEKKIRHIVLILDDIVSSLKAQQNDEQLISLFYNRRHFKPFIHIHFIITTQKWNMIPTKFRAVITKLYVFPITTTEWKTIKDEIPVENIKTLEKHLGVLWGKPNNFILMNLVNKKIFSQFDELLI